VLELVRSRAEDLARALRRTARKSPSLTRAYRRLTGGLRRASLEVDGLRARLAGASGARESGVNPENMIWIFGSGRSGSTWLRSMMGEMSGHRVWEEPMVGRLFGEFYARAPKENLSSLDFVMGDPIRKGWTRSIRNFVLDAARYSNPRLGATDFLVVKEPNGSVGAPLLMEALPESRMILLVRDPRDVVASVLDAAREGGWLYESRNEGRPRKRNTADDKPRAFVRERARVYRRGVQKAKLAYEAHKGPKVLVRYEDLRANTLGEMKRIYSSLGIPADEQALWRTVEKHAWENLPEEEKGRGKARRKAMIGGWREDLTPEQARAVERVTASLLDEFYPVEDDGNGT
jgi:Sulfotransferase family